jgi:formate dehydrogenase subunit beta
MHAIEKAIKETCKKLWDNGEVNRILAWEKGLFDYDAAPALFRSRGRISRLVYNEHCGVNLSKFLIKEMEKEGKVLVLLKPCDTYGFNQLLSENRINREKVYILGVPCGGMRDEKGLLFKCLSCKGNDFKASDQIIESDLSVPVPVPSGEEEKLNKMTAEERFAFWRGQLSKCIRCNACRNVCPACSCIKCVFDNRDSGIEAKANSDAFEENLFHIIRAFHVAGRCTDCGECSRVCPQNIPLYLLNRKMIEEMNERYGTYQAGENPEAKSPLTEFKESDPEVSAEHGKGGVSSC